MHTQMSCDQPISIEWISRENRSIESIEQWLRTFGDLVPDPLALRVDVRDYARKIAGLSEICTATVGGEVVGFLSMYANDGDTRKGWITLVSVLDGYRGRGIGRVILSRALALARRQGMESCGLKVINDNSFAVRLYQSMGFRVVSEDFLKLLMEVDLRIAELNLGAAPTPLQSGARLAAKLDLDIDLRIKRDDLFPFVGGGIKARKIQMIWRDVVAGGYDAVVTTGGPQSNHARATALMAAAAGIKCHLVVTLEPGVVYPDTGNILLMRMSGASIEYCEKLQIAERMDAAMAKYMAMGHLPLYIWGGGHCLAGTVAIVEAAAEARAQCGDWEPDYLVFASGTGTTHAGLAIGYVNTGTKVIGISVARSAGQGGEITRSCVAEYRSAIALESGDIPIEFRDEWTEGGYEKSGPELMRVIERAALAGIMVDPTYSGKGLHGLEGLVRSGEIPVGSKVLFWHTGGIMNLQASEFSRGTIGI